MCEKYGGLEKATQAAIKIQQSWRQFKQRIRFQRIKQQNKSQLQLQLRKRSQSIQDPHRHPSITNKHAYHQEASVATPPSVEHNRKRAIGINHFNKLAVLFSYTFIFLLTIMIIVLCICQALLTYYSTPDAISS